MTHGDFTRAAARPTASAAGRRRLHPVPAPPRPTRAPRPYDGPHRRARRAVGARTNQTRQRRLPASCRSVGPSLVPLERHETSLSHQVVPMRS